MISLYRPGSGLLHRLPAGAKLIALAVLSCVIAACAQNAISSGVALVLVFGLFLLSGIGVTEFFLSLWRLRFLVLVLAAFLVVFVSPLAAWTNTVRMVSILLLAGLVTMTTRTGDLLDVLRRVLRPLRRIGVSPDAVSMVLLLTIAMVPVIAGFADRLREARAARGVRAGAYLVVPLLVMTLRHADEVGDAMVARGLE